MSLLHLATHAVVDERDPEHAAVVLAPGSESEDGRLEPQEIGRLSLGGRTVVLAGCETSAGPAAWADVVLLGDAEVRPRARESVALLPLALAGLVLSVVGVGAGRRRRSRPPSHR